MNALAHEVRGELLHEKLPATCRNQPGTHVNRIHKKIPLWAEPDRVVIVTMNFPRPEDRTFVAHCGTARYVKVYKDNTIHLVLLHQQVYLVLLLCLIC